MVLYPVPRNAFGGVLMLDISRKIGHLETTNQADVTFATDKVVKPTGFI